MRWFLFETRLGDLFLYLFEALTGLAIVDQSYLAGLTVPLLSPNENTRLPSAHSWSWCGLHDDISDSLSLAEEEGD